MTITRKRPTRMSDTRNQPMPYAHFCVVCKVEVGRSTHLEHPEYQITCSRCRKQMREGVAA